MNPFKYKRNKRQLVASQQSKISRTTSRSAYTRNATSDSLSRVTPLSKAKDSPENRSFSCLDYDLMKDMFKGRGRLLLDAAQALQDSPPTVSDFNFSESHSQYTQCIDELPLPSSPQLTPVPIHDHDHHFFERNILQDFEPPQEKNYGELTPVKPINKPQVITPINDHDHHFLDRNTLQELEPPHEKNYTELTPMKPISKPHVITNELIRVESPSLLCLSDISAMLAYYNESLSEHDFTLLNDGDLTDCETPTKEIPAIPTCSSSLLISFNIEPPNDCDLTDCETPIKEISAMPSCSSSHPIQYNIEPYRDSNSTSELDDSDADPDYDTCPNNENQNSDSDSNQSSSSIPNPKTRKSKANPELWKRNIVKKLKNSGKQYTNVKGNLVQAKTVGPPCGENCRHKCSTKFDANDREQIFNIFWALGDISDQRAFVLNSMDVVEPKYRYPKQNENQNPRELNRAYYLNKNKRERVCKKFLLSTLSVSEKCIRTTVKKTKDGNFSLNELIGKHQNHPKVPEERKDGARQHMLDVPKVEAHYIRADTSREYLEGGQVLSDLYEDYKKDCQNRGKEFVSLSMYRKLFNFEFNFGFFKPKKDLCQFCETFKNSTDTEKLDKQFDHIRHHEEKDLARSEKASDKAKISKHYKVACFDLQAALPSPNGEVSTFYYKSKLSTYNFTVVELTSIEGLGSVHCYIWHEGEGNKGSTETGSCLLDYLKRCASESSDDIESVFYSDNCSGQNKNRYLIATYLYAVANLNIKAITHKFLIVGHTQNEGDTCHSVIERSIKKSLRARPVYVPSQYVTLISTAKKTGPPFIVHELCHDFFWDLKNLAELTTTNFNEDSDGDRFAFNDICAIRVKKEYPDRYFYKTSFKDEIYKMVDVTYSKTRKQLIKFTDVELIKAYADPIPISKNKYKDLMSLVKSNTIPQYYSGFYENLTHE